MAELDDLPEKVRDALILLPCMASSAAEDMAVDAVQTELMRLARDNAELRTALNHVNDNTLRAKQAESELAALKARIAEAPVIDATPCADAPGVLMLGEGYLLKMPAKRTRVALLDMGKEG